MKRLCIEKDPVWDRPCEREEVHIYAPEARVRLHRNEKPGDVIHWGSIADVKEAAL